MVALIGPFSWPGIMFPRIPWLVGSHLKLATREICAKFGCWGEAAAIPLQVHCCWSGSSCWHVTAAPAPASLLLQMLWARWDAMQDGVKPTCCVGQVLCSPTPASCLALLTSSLRGWSAVTSGPPAEESAVHGALFRLLFKFRVSDSFLCSHSLLYRPYWIHLLPHCIRSNF